MNNAVFRKIMENVRSKQNIRLATSWKQASKLINKPSFQIVSKNEYNKKL